MDKTLFTISACNTQDAPALSLIGAATFLSSFVDIIDGDGLVKHCHKEHSIDYYEKVLSAPDPRFKCWLLRYAPTRVPVGYIMTSDIQLPVAHTPRDIELKRIYILPEYVGHGLGKRMMDTVIDFACTLDSTRILLGTYGENKTAVRFYENAGFHTIGRRDFNIGGVVYDDIVMAKDL